MVTMPSAAKRRALDGGRQNEAEETRGVATAGGCGLETLFTMAMGGDSDAEARRCDTDGSDVAAT